MTTATIPGIFRVEIKAEGPRDLLRATAELRKLADDIDMIAGQYNDDETVLVLSYHKVREASNKLRAGL